MYCAESDGSAIIDTTLQASQLGVVETVSLKEKHVMLFRSLLSVQHYNKVVIQVMNTGTTPATLYKRTNFASFTPQKYVFGVDKATLSWEGSPQTTQQCLALKVPTDNLF